MAVSLSDGVIDGIPVVWMENATLRLAIAPSIGGKIVSLVDKATGHEFLWRNSRLSLAYLATGSEYDPNFYGGIDELLPNDIPETINGQASPDHGELWTLALESRVEGRSLTVSGVLPLSGLAYQRTMTMRPDRSHLDLTYRIRNPGREERVFLWKLHAALLISAGEQIICPARTARVVDPQWSRWKSAEPFVWPSIGGQRADRIPPIDGTMDFLYLYDLQDGRIEWRSYAENLCFRYTFDLHVFPYAWYFASYGGFDGHYVAILEPCSTMPLSVNEAAALGQCSRLAAGASLETKVSIYAGPAEESHDV